MRVLPCCCYAVPRFLGLLELLGFVGFIGFVESGVFGDPCQNIL
jgi:hypothetical protein